MDFDEMITFIKDFDAYGKRPHWPAGIEIFFNDDGNLVYETTGLEYSYVFSWEDYKANDWDFLRTD